MKLLLDTCTILYSTLAPGNLGEEVKRLLQLDQTEVFVSVVSAGELACGYGKRIHLDRHWKQWFRDRCEAQRWNVLPVDLAVMEEAYSLPEPFHRDPCDRILVATSRIHRIPLATDDRLITAYPHVQICW